MTSDTYNRVTNAAIVCGIVAVLAYSRVGDYAWLAMSIALICGAVTLVSYFRFSWSPAPNESSAVAAFAGDVAQDAPRTMVVSVDGTTENVFFPTAPHVEMWRKAMYDPRAIGHLLAELEKQHWNVSGTLSVCHPSATDVTVKVIISRDTMRIVPTIEGGRSKSKQPASIPALRFVG